ncbi:dihydroxyacetone kinase subunit DhaK [Bacillus testis]|uniref:dihydroxyacetone kinase subunit DhaK n=1 Tax=Bacillus testis TaxID=1622072 RepID=UPI00067E87BE|nr:dihydroxyacetone kinase subunit DhaK [Bacillus testis]
MKKILNDPNQVVKDMLAGLVAAHGGVLKQLPGTTVVAKKESPVKGKVGLVSGGGSGHEPAHAGYIGKGMLDAAVCGEVFTSPTPDQVQEAIKAVDGGAGVLLIVKNYSGDVMNFDMAAELAKMEEIEVEQVIVNDDVAIEDPASRRGIAGTVFVHKIAGAKAESGASLAEVKATAEKAIQNLRSMGMALSACTIPAAGKPGFTIASDEMELGMGIHGEPGIETLPLSPADAIADQLLAPILKEGIYEEGDEVALMINGLGSTPLMEQYILAGNVLDRLKSRKLNVCRTFVGDYMTAIDMAGVSVTLLKLDEELKELLLAPSDAQHFTIQ